MDQKTLQACIDIAEDVKRNAERAALHLTYGALYGEQCKIDAAEEIIERIRSVAGQSGRKE